MMGYIWILALTIVLELCVAYTLKFRTKKELISVLAVNLLTHPVLTLLIMVSYVVGIYHFFIVILLEVAVVIVEWKGLIFALNNKDRKFLQLSIVMNVVSYGVGLIL